MTNLIYDGSYEGMLTCIHEIYYRHIIPDKILCEEEAQLTIFSENIHIETDIHKSEKVYNAVLYKISPVALENITYVYLSDHMNAGLMIYHYLDLGWKLGKKLDSFLSDDRVLQIHQLKRKVQGETHRMLGLLRFRKVDDDIFFAPINPDYNILGLIAPHFADRFPDQRWIIYDVNRKIAAMYDKKEWIIESISIDPLHHSTPEEKIYQDLWKEFFRSISIKERENPKLQKKNMPKRYWTYLVEKNS